MKLFGLLTFGALVNGQTPQQSQMMKRFSRTERFLNKWINDNVDSRYKRYTKLIARKNDYIKRMDWALNSPCSALYVDDEVDQDLDEIESADDIGARADIGPPSLETRISNGMRLINIFKKLAKQNLSECHKKPRINSKAEKLRQALKKAASQTDKLLKKNNAANWSG